MKFKIHKNLANDLAVLLNELGHTVYDERLQGTDDRNLVDACKCKGRTLVTEDLDFSDIIPADDFLVESTILGRGLPASALCGSQPHK